MSAWLRSTINSRATYNVWARSRVMLYKGISCASHASTKRNKENLEEKKKLAQLHIKRVESFFFSLSAWVHSLNRSRSILSLATLFIEFTCTLVVIGHCFYGGRDHWNGMWWSFSKHVYDVYYFQLQTKSSERVIFVWLSIISVNLICNFQVTRLMIFFCRIQIKIILHCHTCKRTWKSSSAIKLKMHKSPSKSTVNKLLIYRYQSTVQSSGSQKERKKKRKPIAFPRVREHRFHLTSVYILHTALQCRPAKLVLA